MNSTYSAEALFVFVILVAIWTYLIMLALGNFSFNQFGYIDCFPAGIILNGLVSDTPSKD